MTRARRLASVVAIALLATACHPPVAAVLTAVVPPPIILAVPILPELLPQRHDIGSWLDDDQVCVLLPPTQAVYVTRQCLSMRAIRQLILMVQASDEAQP